MVEQGRTMILFLSGLTPRCEQIFPHRCCFQPVRRFRQRCPTVFDTSGWSISRRPGRAAERAALTAPWSSGQAEGQITRLKLIKCARQHDILIASLHSQGESPAPGSPSQTSPLFRTCPTSSELASGQPNRLGFCQHYFFTDEDSGPGASLKHLDAHILRSAHKG